MLINLFCMGGTFLTLFTINMFGEFITKDNWKQELFGDGVLVFLVLLILLWPFTLTITYFGLIIMALNKFLFSRRLGEAQVQDI